MSSKKNIILLICLFIVPAIPALIFSGKVKLAEPPLVNDPYRIKIQDVKESVLWLDARKKSKYEEKHIPGALLVDAKDWEVTLAGIFEVFEPGQTIIVYCNPGCSSSRPIAIRLRKELGQENIYYLDGGMDSWFKVNP